jgi:malonyl-CoA O-methyltransferase
MSPAPPTSRPVDALALRRFRRRLAAAGAPPWLHGEVARRMAERLAIVRRTPSRVLAWDAAVGGGLTLLRQAYPQARLEAVEPDAESLPTASSASSGWRARWFAAPRAAGQADTVLRPEDVRSGAAALLWSNMALHLHPDPAALFAAWHRALQADGFLMFSTLGPGTLASWRALYAAAGWPSPHAPFVDMHDLGDLLVQAGFADPVMDQETVTLTWTDPAALLAELRSLGGNADLRRAVGLRTPRWREALCRALAQRAGADGSIALEFEVVYGHAFKPEPRPRVAAETAIAVDELRRMARRRPDG